MTMQPGQRVRVDITGLVPGVNAGGETPATILGPGDRLGTVHVQLESAFNGQDVVHNVPVTRVLT